jgi:predicted pyridoxine 5'-phosphate oxidase superfamily flavin-nucleotide-binding protein
MPSTQPRTMFHDGEHAVQRRAGVERVAAQVGRTISSRISHDHAEFLRDQTFVVVAGRDDGNRVWASLLTGPPGFAQALDERRLLLTANLTAGDPLAVTFGSTRRPIGILAIEPDTRRRIRLNGTAEHTAEGILVTVSETFGNCPKFIQRRVRAQPLPPAPTPRHQAGLTLDTGQVALVRGADTFFIASSHPERGADASHRGGRPGFVEVSADGASLRFPDYPGNRMFQTLGNLAVDPRAGLLFVDWERGSALRLTGRARLVWDELEISTRPAAERLVDFEIDAIIEHDQSLPERWELIEPSRRNPPVRTPHL